MNRYDIEKIYQENGLNDYRLTCLEDLKNCHGIDAEKIKGYEDLTEENKEIFRNFIVNYFNGQGMGRKMITVPKAINYVEDIDYIAADPRGADDEYYKNYVISVVRKINIIKANGKKKQLHKYQDDEYKNIEPTKEVRKEYLRFEFKEGKSNIWLHVTHEGTQWY
jgi:phage anti-repressor protein